MHCHLDDEEQGEKKQNKSPAEEYAALIFKQKTLMSFNGNEAKPTQYTDQNATYGNGKQGFVYGQRPIRVELDKGFEIQLASSPTKFSDFVGLLTQMVPLLVGELIVIG